MVVRDILLGKVSKVLLLCGGEPLLNVGTGYCASGSSDGSNIGNPGSRLRLAIGVAVTGHYDILYLRVVVVKVVILIFVSPPLTEKSYIQRILRYKLQVVVVNERFTAFNTIQIASLGYFLANMLQLSS